MYFSELNEQIPGIHRAAAEEAARRWDAIAKPLGSLGLLETSIIRVAAVTGSANVRLDKRAVLVLCADNGVVAEGVTQTDSSVTMLVAKNLTRRQTSVCLMAKQAQADVIPVDIGMNTRPDFPGLTDCRVADGTRNLYREPAMTREQAIRAIEHGINLARDCAKNGYNILATGEMGIGNTTTSSAVAAALLSAPVRGVTGRGSGLTDTALARKIAVIETAISRLKPDASPLEVLAEVGGFDIAGMAGIFIGGALCGIPVLIDGFISAVSALLAARLCPNAVHAMLASHVSGEPAGGRVLSELGLEPMITAHMRLGEGTGAVAALPLLDLALAVYSGSSSFAEIGMDAYTEQSESPTETQAEPREER
ncbi:MAG: nicotinate-nucleotide--dimethylbenzimidazole phosphoribosyltransferase [Oscillospiraceae bacterium]|jgi:nicotinate-nucleotide--dimethylbenzimidazole phosphoribosyltransferase|nr:nicotinate-nucleotide--dimethylbenzimidazole phosphoribosyltransferase [Oscillospiraceae bacterium]